MLSKCYKKYFEEKSQTKDILQKQKKQTNAKKDVIKAFKKVIKNKNKPLNN